MKKAQSILQFIGAIIIAMCLAMFILSVVCIFLSNTDKEVTYYVIFALFSLGLGITSIFAQLDEI